MPTLYKIFFISCLFALCTACQQTPSLIQSNSSKEEYVTSYDYDIDLNSNNKAVFYQLLISNNSTSAYSAKNMKLLKFKKLTTIETNDVKSVVVKRDQQNKTTEFLVNEKLIIKSEDTGFSTRVSAITSAPFCHFKPNNLYFTEYYPKVNDREESVVSIIGLMEDLNTGDSQVKFDWIQFFSNQNNLYSIYNHCQNGKIDCSANFDLNFK